MERVQVYHIPHTFSTQEDARTLVGMGRAMPLVVHADRQVRGRGRDGATWHAIEGVLTATWAFERKSIDARPHHVGILAALAVCEAIDLVLRDSATSRDFPLPRKPMIKWPNDIVLDFAKVGGLLCETFDKPRPAVLVGVGLNVACDEAELRTLVTDQAVASLIRAEHRTEATMHQTRDAITARMLAIRERYVDGDWPALLSEVRDRDGALGRRICVRQGSRCVEGTAAGLSDDAALQVQLDDGSMACLPTGSVEWITGAESA